MFWGCGYEDRRPIQNLEKYRYKMVEESAILLALGKALNAVTNLDCLLSSGSNIYDKAQSVYHTLYNISIECNGFNV